MTGWCPRHDAIVESTDGLCPKCGAALVVDETPSRRAPVVEIATESEVEIAPEPADDGRAMRDVAVANRRVPSVAWIAVALTAAFVAGLAFPDVRPDDARPVVPLREVNADLNVGVTRTAFDLGLRLESFTQRGRHIVARVSVPDPGDLVLGDLRTAFVALRTGSAGGEIFEPMEVRSTVSGFILEGEVVPRPDVAVLGLRIDTLNFAASGDARTSLDLTGVWPATETNQPRAKRAGGKLEPVAGRRYEVTGLIGWANRLDVGVSLTGKRHPGYQWEESWLLTSGTNQVGAMYSGGAEGVVTFLGVPADFRKVKLHVTVGALAISGLWEWSFV